MSSHPLSLASQALAADHIARLPMRCYAVVPESRPGDRVVMIVAGAERALVTTLDDPTLQVEQVEKLVDKLNARMHVTRAQQNAMFLGSMFGWHQARADADKP